MATMVLGRRTRVATTIAALGAIAATAFVVGRGAVAARSPLWISAAITFDLTVTSSLIVWWLLVRPRIVSTRLLRTVFVLGLVAAAALAPAAALVRDARLAVAAVELVVLVATVRTLLPALRGVRTRAQREPLLPSLRRAFAGTFGPRLAAVLATDAAAIVYAFSGRPRLDARASEGERAFAHGGHAGAIVGLLAFLSLVEAGPLHLLVSRASPTAAWVVLALQAYALVWLVGDLRALRAQPILVTPDAIHVTVGLRWSALIPRALVAEVRLTSDRPPGTLRLAAGGATNVLITLRDELTVDGPWGLTRRARTLALCLRDDDVAAFVTALDKK